jgi:hypothetical protein
MHHDGARVADKRLLQHLRELRPSERDVALALVHRADALLQKPPPTIQRNITPQQRHDSHPMLRYRS